MERFHPTTSAEEARALTVGCLQVIASGWSIIYMRPAKISGLSGNQSLEPDIDRMIADAADIAAKITQAAEDRRGVDMTCSQSPTHYHELENGWGSPCAHCGKVM